MCMVLCPQELQRNSLNFSSLHFKTKSLHIYHVSSLHIITPHHFTYLHTNPTKQRNFEEHVTSYICQHFYETRLYLSFSVT